MLAGALLISLQFGLLGRRQLSVSETTVHAASTVTPPNPGAPSDEALLKMLRGTTSSAVTSAALPLIPASASTLSLSAAAATAAAARAAAANRTDGKHCGKATDSTTEFPRNRILIIHEQHLQSMGCDVRLLRFVKDLLYLNQEVSMLFRGSTPSKMRQPKSRQLAQILHIENFEEEQLRKGIRQPPGIYEWTSAERFAQLMSMGYFNVVIIFLWFWYDPQPSVAELVLPLIRAHAPADRQPFVAVLSDDAHSIRSSRLGEVEIHLSTREGYNERARNYFLREKHMYSLIDMAMHISPMDQVAEKSDYPFVKYYKLLRMPIRAFRILNKNTGVMQERSFLHTANIGFIGNGMTPTNHLGIQWFLENCWEDLQRQLPGVRMRLIGRPPGERMLKGQPVPCVRKEDAHCGWAWGTPYAGYEVENGIDELGYLSAEELLTEVLSWRLMIVPVLRTTGVNTKILVALELGVPLVITPVAASPFDIPENETIVAFADQALDFVQQTTSVYTVSWLWTQLARASRQHWENLATHDPARQDVRVVLATICQDTSHTHYLQHYTPPPLKNEPASGPILALPKPPAAKAPPLSTCLAGGNWSNIKSPPLLLVGSHAMVDVFPKFDGLMQATWSGICKQCSLRCKWRSQGSPYTLSEVDVLIDPFWALPLDEIDHVPHRMLFYYWDPGKMGRYFHYNGNLLRTVGASEQFIAQALRRPKTALGVRVNQEMRSSGGFVFNWRKALTHLGFPKPAIAKIVQGVVSKLEANFTRELLAHMALMKSG